MRLRLLFCVALALLLAATGIALADTVQYGETTYIFPGEAAEAKALTLRVEGEGFDLQSFAPVHVPSLPGAVFGVYAKDGQGNYVPYRDPSNPLQALTLVSGEEPVTVPLPASVDLYIKQETAPEGYVIGDGEGEYAPLSLPETITRTNRMADMQGVLITLTGIGAPRETPLAGVEFMLEGGGEKYTLTTDAQGQASLFGIAPGDYVLRQKTVPEGYHIDQPEMAVTIVENRPSEALLQNSLNGNIQLRALGLSLDGNRVPRLIPIERKYQVLDAEGTSQGILATGETLNLPASAEGVEYTLSAVDQVGDGFSLDGEAHTVTVFPGQTALCQPVVKSERGFFQFQSAAGGAFVLYDAAGREALAFETDADGQYEPEAPLPRGEYTVRMDRAPEGYLYTDEEAALSITPYFGEEPPAQAEIACEPVPVELFTPTVAANAQEYASLFEQDADIAFVFSAFADDPPLPVRQLSYSFSLPELAGTEIIDRKDDGASMRILRRFALEGVEEIRDITVRGTVSYAFSYRVDAEGNEQTIEISEPFEAVVAIFAPMGPSKAYQRSGYLYDEVGAALAGHPVSLEDDGGNTIAEIVTDPFGAYAFAEMPRGAVINFHAPEGYGVKEDVGDAHILPLRTIHGRVETEGPVEGYPAMILIGEEEPVEPDAKGNFSVTGIFEEGTVVLARTGEGILVRVEQEGDEAVVTLVAAASVSGAAKDPEGEAVEGVQISLSDGQGEVAAALTDAFGNYAMEELFPGDYTMTYAAPEGYVLNGDASVSFTLEAGDARRGEDIGAMLPAAIDGVVYDGDAPYEGVTVTLMPGWAEAVTGPDGRFSFEGLPVGVYTLELDTPQDTILLDMPGEISLAKPSQRETHEIHTVRPAGLSGQIWLDANDDGLITYDEEGLAGVRIVLQNDGEEAVAEITTAKDGLFHFDGLTPGRYRLAVTLPGDMLFAKAAPGMERIVVGVDAPEGSSEWYTLGSGEQKKELVAGAITPGSIGGAFWEDINGNGVLDDGEPMLEGVSIALVKGETALSSLVTDANGAYRFDRLRMGDYLLRVTLPEGCMFTAQAAEDAEGVTSRMPRSDARAGEIRIELRRWRTDSVVNAGAQRAASLSAHMWFDTDASGVNPGASGYAGLNVALYSVSGASESLVAQRETDGGGNVSFEHLRPGAYQLRYTLPEERGWGFTTGVAKAAESTGTSALITLENGAAVQAEQVGVTKLGRISGIVFEDANYNGLRDDSEYGVASTVTLLNAAGEAVREIESKNNGEYVLDGIPSGRYQVRFTLPGAYAFTLARPDATSFNSDVPETSEPVSQTDTLFLPMGEALLVDAGAYRRASISGSVWQDTLNNGLYSSDNPPLEGIDVALLLGEGEEVASMRTDAEGGFRFENLPPSEYTLMVTLPEGMRFSRIASGSGRRSIIGDTDESVGYSGPLSLRNGENKTERDAGVVYEGAVIGSAVDVKSGGGLSGVRVTLLRESLVIGETVTDEMGGYRFDGVRPGAGEILFDAPEGWIITEEETNPARVAIPQRSDSAPVSINCIPEATIGGVIWLDGNADGVRDAEEAPLPGASVALYAVNGEERSVMDTAETDAEGRYAFGLLLPGVYSLQFGEMDGVVFYDGVETEAMSLSMGGAAEYDAAAYRGATVSGAVWEDLDNNGLWDRAEPGIEAAEIALVLDSGKVLLETLTDERGQYRFEDVPPVSCAIRVTLPETYMFTEPVEGGSVLPMADGPVAMTESIPLSMDDVLTGQNAGVLRFTRVGDLVWLDENGNGLQDTGEPGVEGIEVTLWQEIDGEGMQVDETQTDKNGRYRFDVLRPGTYYVMFVLGEQYLPTVQSDGLNQINSKIPWRADLMAATEPFIAESGRFALAVDAGLVPIERAAELGWTMDEDGAIHAE